MSVETLAPHQQSVVEELLVHPDVIEAQEIHGDVVTIDVNTAQPLATPTVAMDRNGNTTTQYLLGVIEHGPNTTLGLVGAVVETEGQQYQPPIYSLTELGSHGTHAIEVARFDDPSPRQPLVGGEQSRLQMVLAPDPEDGRLKFAVRTDPVAQQEVDNRRMTVGGQHSIEGNKPFLLMQGNEHLGPDHPVLADIDAETWALPPEEIRRDA